MDSMYLGVVPASLLAAFWLGQRWLDRRAERIGRERAEREAADAALREAIALMRREVVTGACTRCAQQTFIDVVCAWNRRYGRIDDGSKHATGPLYEALELLEPHNNVPF